MSDFITEADLFEEYKRLDILRETQRKIKLTDEQFKIIDYARTHGKPIKYIELIKYWENKGWGSVSETTLRNWYEREKKIRNI